jgi:predicted MFS family arabinose efflux permease
MFSVRHLIMTTIVFLGGFAIMVLEITGARYLAKDFGGSFYVWISQIGIILIALALGYYIGGACVDHWQRVTFLATLLILAGVYVGLIPHFSEHIIQWIIMRHPLDQDIPAYCVKLDPVLGSALIFLGPCFILAMLSPYMIRLATQHIAHVGRVSGLIYAASTLGSIAGVFVSGYILIDLMPLSNIFYVTGISITLLAFLCLTVDQRQRP